MTSILNVESTLYQILKDGLKIEVFNHVPDYAELPLLRIGKIDYHTWLISPKALRATFELSIFSNKTSNIEVIELAEKTKNIIQQIPNSFVTESSIHQFKDGTWCADLTATFILL